jgi:hypothetical protein
MEHRWGRRQSTNLTVRFFATSGAIGVGRVLNISLTGAFMETTVHLRTLSLVYLESLAPPFGESKSRRMAASVVRQDAIGIGLEWCESAAETMTVDTRLTTLAGGITDTDQSPLRERPLIARFRR